MKTISDVSYLNIEGEIFPAFTINKGNFYVKIPFSSLSPGSTYALKGFIKGKNKNLTTLPPYEKIKFHGQQERPDRIATSKKEDKEKSR